MNLFQFMGEHPFLTVIILLIIAGCIENVVRRD